MKQEVLKHWDVPWLPVTALLLFVFCFALYTYWTFKKERKGIYEMVSKIPLDDATEDSMKGRFP